MGRSIEHQKDHIRKMGIIEISMLRWVCEDALRLIWNEDIQKKVGVVGH